MDVLRLTATRVDLAQSLRVLGTHRRRRFSSVVPIWLSFDPQIQELRLSEERAHVLASVPASGEWPAAGATVNLFMLRAAVRNSPELVELLAAEDAVVVPTSRGYVRLDLLPFGPDCRMPKPEPKRSWHAHLPLFHWAASRNRHY
jgi:hypothetical protein